MESNNSFKSLNPIYKQTYSDKKKGNKLAKFKRINKYLTMKPPQYG